MLRKLGFWKLHIATLTQKSHAQGFVTIELLFRYQILSNIFFLYLGAFKDLTYQDSCYWKVYLTPSEGHGIGWPKPSFWWIWCDSRGHLVLRSTSITKIYASSNPPCANLSFSFTFIRVNTADGLKSMADLNLGWFIWLLCLFLFATDQSFGPRLYDHF